MSVSLWILFWWALFALSHTLIAEYRAAFINRLGKLGYSLFYNAVSFATFIPIVGLYIQNPHGGGLLYAPPPWLQTLGMGLATFGIALLPAALFKASPVSMIPGNPTARGLIRITRHPLFMGFALWGLGHCLILGYTNDLLFFGGFAAFAVIGAAHQDSRKRRQDGERLGALYAETSLLPFGAIFAGRNKLVLGEIPWLLLGIGLALAFLLYRLHPLMFG
ncbi:MAG: NnrU family protein [Salinisphaeraceae bacterium]|nr:NnrU family protein [Salinisphaeraceae bacterium]